MARYFLIYSDHGFSAPPALRRATMLGYASQSNRP
jgi:hypothetical protein